MDAYEMAKAAGAFGVADELERLKVEYAAAIERGMRATADLQGKLAAAEARIRDVEGERDDAFDAVFDAMRDRAEAAEAEVDKLLAAAIYQREEKEKAEVEVARLKVEYAAAIERGMRATAELQGKVAEAEDLLLLAYHSGHREGWEAGPTTDETMSRICDWLANEDLDPNLSREAKRRLRALRGEGEKP